MGFHTRTITQGVYGELSKVREELEEAEDAMEQGQKLILFTELADIVGAVEGVALAHGITLEDLLKYARIRSEIARKSLELTGGKSTYGA